MELTFYGAAGEVTGSNHLINFNGKKILLDCGLYQGKRKEAFEKNRNFPYSPADIDAVLLSHAHMDHSGNIPTLVKLGFTGPIFCTDATSDLCKIMFRDCAYIQTRDVEYVNKKRLAQGRKPFEPLYSIEQADAACQQLRPIGYNKNFAPISGLDVSFHDAGHILGSAFTSIKFSSNGSTKKLMFTGDIGRRDIPILKDPRTIEDIDYLITESTYGDRKHPPAENAKAKLQELVNNICTTGGKLIIPAFSIGRTQMIVYLLNQLHAEGKICSLPVYVDSPLSNAATTIYSKHSECWDADAMHFLLNEGRPFSFKGLHYTESVNESIALNDTTGPMIIISASGMCEAGRILHHLKNNITDPKNIILIVGYMAHNTLGRRIAEKQPTVKIFGDELPLNARVEEIAALSAHADKFEMLEYFNRCGVKNINEVFCVHGEENALAHFADTLTAAGISKAHIPTPAQSYTIG